MDIVLDPTTPTAHISPDEAGRMRAVNRYEILDTPPDGTFDRITLLATRLFQVPISTITIVDEDRIWYKSAHGIEVEEIGRDPGLCASAVLGSGPWVVNDAKLDPRTLDNPLVTGELGLRFYAGIPLVTSDGHNLGTLNIIDASPREMTDDELELLQNLADIVVDELELRLATKRVWAKARRDTQRAIEISETVGSRLASANTALKSGQIEQAARTLHEALEASQSIVTSLLAEAGDELKEARPEPGAPSAR
jgi:GAF domain-containing protein